MIEGIGLPDGEGNERIWSRGRHVIPSLRVVTPGKRFQILTELFLFIAEEKDRMMGRTFRKSFKLALGKIDNCKKDARKWLLKPGFLPDEIAKQAQLMRDFFKNPSAKTSQDVYAHVCETITAIVVLANFQNTWLHLPQSSQRTSQLSNIIVQIRSISGGRIDLMGGVTIDSLRRDLLGHISSTTHHNIRDWISDDNIPTQNYFDYSEDVFLTSLRYRRNEIFAILVEQKMELTEIRANFLGTYPTLSNAEL
jgi:Kyakuja-Dileera-Zisupton transposase